MTINEINALRDQLNEKLAAAISKRDRLTANRASASMAAALGDADAASACAEMDRQKGHAESDIISLQHAISTVDTAAANALKLESATADLERAERIRLACQNRKKAAAELDKAMALFSQKLRNWFEAGADLSAISTRFKIGGIHVFHHAYQYHLDARRLSNWQRQLLSSAGDLANPDKYLSLTDSADWRHAEFEASEIEGAAASERARTSACVDSILRSVGRPTGKSVYIVGPAIEKEKLRKRKAAEVA